MNAPRLVLASASPRRHALLESWGVPHEIRDSGIDESTLARPDGVPDIALAMAAAKARAVSAALAAEGSSNRLVLGADTLVGLAGEALGKPRDAADARAMLARASGREVDVSSAAVLFDDRERELDRRVVTVRLEMRAFDREEIAAYVATGEPMDKAGAFAIQGLGARLIARVHGPRSAVIGLPRDAVLEMLAAAGLVFPPRGEP